VGGRNYSISESIDAMAIRRHVDWSRVDRTLLLKLKHVHYSKLKHVQYSRLKLVTGLTGPI
jgi:hypothetical protein